MNFTGKVALITGASRNIGRATALAFAQNGLSVAVHARTSGEVERVAAEARELGAKAISVTAEISDWEQVSTMTKVVSEQLGPVDILVNNAAVRPLKPFLDMTPQEFDEVIKVNLYGAFYACRALAPGMAQRGHGVIINVTGATTHLERHPHKSHVHVSKTAVWALTRTLARELGPFGIRVNAVAPSELDTERQHREWYSGETLSKERVNSIPLRRLGRPEEVAQTIVFLASDSASFVTGQTLHVSGGLVIV